MMSLIELLRDIPRQWTKSWRYAEPCQVLIDLPVHGFSKDWPVGSWFTPLRQCTQCLRWGSPWRIRDRWEMGGHVLCWPCRNSLWPQYKRKEKSHAHH